MRQKKFYIDKSKIDGDGVFAGKDLKKGEIAFIVRGELVHIIEKTKEQSMTNPNRIGVGKNLWIDPVSPARHINHSCNPNLGMRGRFWFTALRNIRKGEELTFDYSISEDSVWEMRCRCGEKNCRKKITGIRSLPEEIYKKYLPFIPKYFQEVYKKGRALINN